MHYISLLLLCFWTTANAQMSFTDYYLESIQRTHDYTVELIEIMPESKFDYRPVQEVNTFHDQVTHIIKNIGFLQTYLTGYRDSPIRDMDLESNSKEELLNNLELAFNHLKVLTRNLSDGELSASVNFFKKDVQMDKRAILLLIKNHMTLHQGQLIMYLRLIGLTPPKFNGY